MAAPTPPVGYSSAELDAMFADLWAQADRARLNALRSYTIPALQPFLNYYLGVPPTTAVLYANSIATAVIKGTAGTCFQIMVVSPGTAGSLTVNNCATVGAATGGNQVVSYLASGMFAGQIIDVNFACNTGIVVSAMPTGGQFTIVYN